MNNPVMWQKYRITKKDRQLLNGHKSFVIWLTGLSGSGKSTLADCLHAKLFALGVRSYVLDGDNIRHGLNKNLGFNPDDRKENIRRIGEVSKLFVDAGVVAIVASISPYEEDRQSVRKLFDDGEFIEVYVKCPVYVCALRDPKGLYAKARKGEISNFTGVSAPYEEPSAPEIIVDTSQLSVEQCQQLIFDGLRERGLLNQTR